MIVVESYDARDLITGDSVRDKLSSLLHNVHAMPQAVIENLSFHPNGVIFDNAMGIDVGVYKFIDDALPIIGFTVSAYMPYCVQKREGIYPQFVPMLIHKHNVGIMVQDTMAPAHLHDWLMAELFTQWMDKPGYAIRRFSNPFFQGGAHDPFGGWFYIEFLGSRDVYKTTAWINENFRYLV